MKFDLIVRSALLVSSDKTRKADIFINNGKFEFVTAPGSIKNPQAVREIDAAGKYVLPGVIDPHVHFSLPVGKIITSDDFSSGSAAAVRAGITTVIDYTTQGKEEKLSSAIEARRKEADGKVFCDYALHCVIPSWKQLANPKEQMQAAIKMGVPSFKLFMIYEERGMMADDGDIYAALLAGKELNALICLHAESERIIKHLINQYKDEKFNAYAHALSRPDFTEWEAVQRAITWAEVTKGKLYFVHLSAGRSAELIRQAQKRKIKVIGETCPQYLTLDDSVFKKKNGHYYATCPQIKTKRDSLLLWRALKDGAISVIATDSCTFDGFQKDLWDGDFTKIPYGIPGVETSLPLIFTHGVKAKKITVNKLVQLMCENPARIMGLKNKGFIKRGFDADFIIIDPNHTATVKASKMETKSDFSPYEGQKLFGYPEHVYLRGNKVVNNYKVAAAPAIGKFVERSF